MKRARTNNRFIDFLAREGADEEGEEDEEGDMDRVSAQIRLQDTFLQRIIRRWNHRQNIRLPVQDPSRMWMNTRIEVGDSFVKSIPKNCNRK